MEIFIYKDIRRGKQIVTVATPQSAIMNKSYIQLLGKMTIIREVMPVTNNKGELAMVTVDYKSTIDFDNDYVLCRDTSLFKGFGFGKISKHNAEIATRAAGFKFYKIIELKPLGYKTS